MFLSLLPLLVLATAKDLDGILPQCSPFSCNSTWSSWGDEITLPCDVASGHLPLGGLQLPMIFDGDYDLCLTFSSAHVSTPH